MAKPPDYTAEQRAALAKLRKLRRERETRPEREHAAIIDALRLNIRVGVVATELDRSREQVRLARVEEENRHAELDAKTPHRPPEKPRGRPPRTHREQ